MRPDNTAYLLTSLVILFWAGAATIFKTALLHISPSMLLCGGSAISLLVLTLLLLFSGKLHELARLSVYQWLQLLALGTLNPFLYYWLLFQAYELLPGQVAMSLNFLWPIILALLSVPILKHRLTMPGLFAICLSFIGAVIIASAGQWFSWSELNAEGLALVLSSTVFWASYWLLSARLPIDAIIKLFVGFLSGTLLSFLYAYSSGQWQLDFTLFPWLPVAYVGVLEMGISFFIWLKALQLTSNAAKIGNLIYLTPFLSLVFLSLFVGERIYPSTLLGLIFIITGIVLQQYWKGRKAI